MRYLVTGSSGFIGSTLKKALIHEGHTVIDFDLKDESGDIRDVQQLRDKAKSAQGIYHLAAIASVQASIHDPESTFSTNVEGTRHVFEAAKLYDIPVVYASSAAVYGDNQNLPLSEDEPVKPMSPYAEHKLQNEMDAKQSGAETFGLRFFNIYGPGQDPASPYSGVISIFHDRLKAGKAVTIFGDGEQSRDFVAVSDAVAALMHAMDFASANAPVANVCTRRSTTLLELAQTLADILNISPDIRHEAAREGDIRHSQGDPARLRRITGHAPATDLHEGLLRLAGRK